MCHNIDNRTYYSQSFSITVMSYIMPKNSFSVEEKPEIKFINFEGDSKKETYAEIEEIAEEMNKNFDYIPINLKIHFSPCSSKYNFNIDTYFHAKNIILNNIKYFKIYINDKETNLDKNFEVKPNDNIRFSNVVKYKTFENGEIIIEGFNYRESYNINENVDIKEIIIE